MTKRDLSQEYKGSSAQKLSKVIHHTNRIKENILKLLDHLNWNQRNTGQKSNIL